MIDRVSRRLMERMLQQNGYEVITAENGRQVVDELLKKRWSAPRRHQLDDAGFRWVRRLHRGDPQLA